MSENNFPTPDQEAIDWIKQYPQRFADFDAVYGQGAAESINGPFTPKDGFLEDMFKGLTEGALGAVRETGQFVDDVDRAAGAFLDEKLGGSTFYYDGEGFPISFGTRAEAEQALTDQGLTPTDIGDFADKATIFDQERDTAAGAVTQGMAQFLTGLVGVGKLTGMKTFTTIRGGIAGGAVVDGAMFDPDDANFVRMLDEQFGIGNDVVSEILANDDENVWVNRLQNAATGSLIGGTLDGAILGIKSLKAKIKGRKEIEATGELSEATKTEIEAIEAEVKTFADLQSKPKGQIVEGKFITDDGMIFDTNTGVRDFEAEKLTLSQKVEAKTDTPTQPDAPEVEGAPTVKDPEGVAKAPEVLTEAPAPIGRPKKPRSVVKVSALRDAAIKARTLNEGQIVTMDDVNQLGDNLGLFNYEKMDGPLDAIKVMDQVQDALNQSGVLKSMKLDKRQSLDEVKRLAMKELGDFTGDPQMVTKHFQELEAAGRDAAPRIVAGKMALQSTGRRIAELVDIVETNVAKRTEDTKVERELVDMLELHADLQASVKGMQTAAARAVSAGRIVTKDAIEDVTLDRLARYGGSKKVKKLAKQLKASQGNRKATARIIRKANERSFWGITNEVWLNAILSGPRTHIMNIGSNAINMGLRPAQRMVGGALSLNSSQIEEGFRQYVYMIEELGDSIAYLATLTKYGNDSALDNALKSWWREEGVLDTASKFDFDGAGNSRQINGLVGKIVRGAGRTLQAEDEFFKQTIFRSRAKAIVMTNARRLSKDEILDMGYATREEYIEDTLTNAINTKEAMGEKWDEMVQSGQILDDPKAKEEFLLKHIGTYNHQSTVAKQALGEAREATFTTPLADGTVSKKVQDALNEHPFLRQIMPFIQTPTNILRVSFERFPALGLFAGRQLEKIRRGTPDERAMALGQQALGIGITLYAIDQAMKGRITGGGPTYNKEMDKAKLWNASPDWMPYSVNVGTPENPKWLELKKLDPHGMLFGIVGDFFEMIEYSRDNPNPEVFEGIAILMTGIANNITSKTYLASLTDTMNILNGGASEGDIGSMLENRAASMIPYSGLAYQTNQMQDDHMRDMRDFVDKLKARVYGQNDSAPIKHDWLTGEAVDTPEYMLGFIRQKKVDSGEHKAAKVYQELRRVNHGFAGPQRKIGKIELDPEVFQEYNRLVGNVKIGRRNLLQELEHLFESRTYQKASEDAGAIPVESADDPRTALINGVINKYKSAAKVQLYKKYPDLAETVNNNANIEKSIRRGAPRERAEGLVYEFRLD